MFINISCAGPCNPCTAKRRKTCPCGATSSLVKCEVQLVCAGVCGKLLECGQHTCSLTCHAGACDTCQVMVTQGVRSDIKSSSVFFNYYSQCVSVVRVRARFSAVSMSEVLLISTVEKFATRNWIVVTTVARPCVTRAPVPRVLCPRRP